MTHPTLATVAGAAIAAVTALALGAGSAAASMSYECWTYKNGSPHKMTHVTADSNSEAVELAEEKFKRLGIKGLPVKCK
ncbi:hypothetical protein C882_3315 [Caenispirillum salinarum AK4]|uniref:Uncharacterized protein n=1 Tax=Caenispirillum salinarum AK4 TaxID=1238182 RepID=K9HVJ7_9PROT|nr:hypothetical protein [Caenispirillum salinarum]EKV32251.1 hypothetical protein C882_3315 [Caenispirillum salinarum AK4]